MCSIKHDGFIIIINPIEECGEITVFAERFKGIFFLFMFDAILREAAKKKSSGH